MQIKNIIKSIDYEKFFYTITCLHVIVWTILPTLLRHSLPMDALEGWVWGQNLDFGYDRNPWLNAWLTALAVKIGGTWMVYLFSQLSIAACFLVVWKLGKKMLNPLYALIAVLLLEGIQYYTIAAVDFNDNVLEIGLWALTIWFFYSAYKDGKFMTWIMTGFFAGLALMAKYYTLVLLFPLFLFLLGDKSARKNCLKLPFYCGGITFLIIIAPHCLWLFHHNFETIKYALLRISDITQNTITHFALMQLLALLLPALLCLTVIASKHTEPLCTHHNPSKSDRMFLLTIALGPYFFTLIIALIFKMTLHTMWGTPLLSFFPLLLLAYTQPIVSRKTFYRFLISVALVFSAFAGGYSYSIIYRGYESSANYPAQKIAQTIEQQWHKNYNNKIMFVVGDRYTAGNFAYFAQDNPTIIVADKTHPTINNFPQNTLFIWQKDQPILPKNIKAMTQEFYWKRNSNKQPLPIGFAFFPE